MGKQISFITTEQNAVLIADILGKVFGELMVIPDFKSEFLVFTGSPSEEKRYLAETHRLNDIIYRTHQNSDGVTNEILDIWNSPVLEYTPSRRRPDGGLTEGRFYCCSNDLEFLKKVSRFLTRFKKEFLFVKKYKVYISNNIDLATTPLGPIGAELDITRNDLA